MRQFHSELIEQEITAFINEWVGLLSQNKYEEACSLFDNCKKMQDYPHCNPVVLKQTISEYRQGSVVSHPSHMKSNQRGINFYYYTDGTGVGVDYDLPLNGDWSDLTAQFSFKKVSDEWYTTYFDDIHVL